MKRVRILCCMILAVVSFSHAQETEAITHGPCSANIIQNKGQIQYTCEAQLDAESVRKLNDILNEAMAQAKASQDQTAKLDQILRIIELESAQTRQLAEGVQKLKIQNQHRQVTEAQRTALKSSLSTVGPQQFYFLCAPDRETTNSLAEKF